MKPIVRTPLIALGAVLLIGLAGCERAEQAAESMTREVERAATEEARKALQATGEAINRGIDDAQDATRRWLDQAERATEERSHEREENGTAPQPRQEREQPGQGMSI